MSASYYPTQLRSFVQRLHGYSQTTVKLTPLNGLLWVAPKQTVTVSLPPNSLVLPDSFTMWARAETKGALLYNGANANLVPGGTPATAGQSYQNPCVQLPQNAESFITNVAVTMNGMTVDQGPGQFYNQLFNVVADATLGGKKYERGMSQLGRDVQSANLSVGPLVPQIVDGRPTPSMVQPPLSSTNLPYPIMPRDVTAPGVFNGNNLQIIGLSNWLGFLNSPEVLDTDILGDVRVQVTIADTNVLVINEDSTQASTASFTLGQLFFTCNTISLPPEWYQAQSMFLEKGGIIERKFSRWWAFPGSTIPSGGPMSATVSFSLASQSVDLLVGSVFAVPDNSAGGQGAAAAGGRWSDVNAISATNTMPLARYAQKNLGDYAYTSMGKGTSFLRPGHGILNYQFAINNESIPNTAIDMNNALQHALIAFGLANETIQQTNPSLVNMDQWTQGFWFSAISLAAMAPTDVRLISGYETRGSNANFSWTITPSSSQSSLTYNTRPIVFAKISSSLRIGRNRMLEIVN